MALTNYLIMKLTDLCNDSAYLCEGKRVLVTSKNANALSVLRSRLPRSVRELVVDVSMSESQGEKLDQKLCSIKYSIKST